MRVTTLAAVSAYLLTSLSSGVLASHGHGHGVLHQARDIDVSIVDPTSEIPESNTTQLVSRDLGVGMCDEHTPCTNKACCGADGRCGYSPDQCGKGCRFNCDAKAECGQYAPQGSQKCPLNVCCSEFGSVLHHQRIALHILTDCYSYCGSTDDFCKWKGCDTKWVCRLVEEGVLGY